MIILYEILLNHVFCIFYVIFTIILKSCIRYKVSNLELNRGDFEGVTHILNLRVKPLFHMIVF